MDDQSRGFGERLRALRIQSNLTQMELAERIGVAQEQVSRWESGKVLPHASRRRALAGALAVSDHDLWPQTVATAQTTQEEPV